MVTFFVEQVVKGGYKVIAIEGHSRGGFIALQVAERLEAYDVKVKFLLMGDPVPGLGHNLAKYSIPGNVEKVCYFQALEEDRPGFDNITIEDLEDDKRFELIPLGVRHSAFISPHKNDIEENNTCQLYSHTFLAEALDQPESARIVNDLRPAIADALEDFTKRIAIEAEYEKLDAFNSKYAESEPPVCAESYRKSQLTKRLPVTDLMQRTPSILPPCYPLFVGAAATTLLMGGFGVCLARHKFRAAVSLLGSAIKNSAELGKLVR